MATSKTLAPTNVTISIPAMTDQPNASVLANCADKEAHLRSGYSANAEIVLSHADKVLSIPESAIEFSGDSTFVYVVKGEGKNKTYDRTYVETGLSDGVNIEIKKGITAKDKVRGPEIVTDDKEK